MWRGKSKSRNTVIPGRGVFLHNVEEPTAEGFGSACLIAIGGQPRIKGMWLRSPGWDFDSLSALWREVSAGAFTANEGSNEIDTGGRNGGSILFEGTLTPGASEPCCPDHMALSRIATCRLAGSLPSQMNARRPAAVLPEGAPPPWRPYYASIWNDAREVALYVEEQYASLRARTVAFRKRCFPLPCRPMCWMRSHQISPS